MALGTPDCVDGGCELAYLFIMSIDENGECSFVDFQTCIAVDRCAEQVDGLQGYYRGEEVFEFDATCGLEGGWAPCVGDPDEPAACACTTHQLTCE